MWPSLSILLHCNVCKFYSISAGTVLAEWNSNLSERFRKARNTFIRIVNKYVDYCHLILA